MPVKVVKKKSRTKKNNSTTSNQWLTQPAALSDGTLIQFDYSQVPGPGLYSVQSVTQQKQPESGRNEYYKSVLQREHPANDRNNVEVGVKFDQDKPALAYIPKAALYAEGQAFAYGAKKYGSWNYKNGIGVSRTLSAAIRHIYQFLSGEDVDVESNVNHLGCARANLAMALDTLENHPDMDDRFKEGKK